MARVVDLDRVDSFIFSRHGENKQRHQGGLREARVSNERYLIREPQGKGWRGSLQSCLTLSSFSLLNKIDLL